MVKKFLKKIIPLKILNLYYQFLPAIGAFLYRFPSKKLIVIGVTGTNGKSTVVQLITDILKQAGLKVSSISSIRFQIKDKEWQNDLKMTMPGRLKLQRFLRRAVNAGCQYAVLEVTSEGIKQFRHKFIDFNVAVFTNLTPEHIESHGSFEKYREAKAKLFQSLSNRKSRTPSLKRRAKNKKISVINLDDPNADYFLQFEADEKYGYCINPKSEMQNLKTVQAKDVELYENGSSFKIQNSKFKIHLLGRFNIYNALAAICVGLSQGISFETIKEALGRVEGVPGRMELVIKEPFRVYVDYAHTPDALENVYKTLAGSRLICVLGSCGGGRDKWKRPKLGRLAVNYCSQIILTDEDPYDEDPLKILKDIERGILEYKSPTLHHKLIFNRQGAIKEALKLAQPGDVVIITGKGAEPWMCVAGGKKIPWDDRKIVREELEKLKLENEA